MSTIRKLDKLSINFILKKKAYRKNRFRKFELHKQNVRISKWIVYLIRKGFSLKHIFMVFKKFNNTKILNKILRNLKIQLIEKARYLKWKRFHNPQIYQLNLRRKFNNYFLANKSYINFIYQKLFTLLFIFYLILMRWIYKIMNRVVYGLWISFLLFKFKTYNIGDFYKYSYFYKNNYIYIYDKYINKNIHLAIPRYLKNSGQLFKLDSYSAGTIKYRMIRKNKCVYVTFSRGKLKFRTRIYWVNRKPFFHLLCLY